MPANGSEYPTLNQIKLLKDDVYEEFKQVLYPGSEYVLPRVETDESGVHTLKWYVNIVDSGSSPKNNCPMLQLGNQFTTDEKGVVHPSVASDEDFKTYLGIS